MPILLLGILALAAGVAYVATRPKTSQSRVRGSTSPTELLLRHGSTSPSPGGSPDTMYDVNPARARLAADRLLTALEYVPAGGADPCGWPSTVSLVGDIGIELRDREDKRTINLIMTSFPRGEEVRYMIPVDRGPGVASGHNYMTIGTHVMDWKAGGNLPDDVNFTNCFLNINNFTTYKVAQFAVDLADALGISPVSDIYLVGRGRNLFRAEQALHRKHTLWSEIFKPMLPGLISMVGTVLSGVCGIAGTQLGAAITGFCTRAMNASYEALSRRGSLERKIATIAGALVADPNSFELLAACNIEFGLRAGSVSATLAAEMEQARTVLQGWGADKALAAATMNAEARIRAMKLAPRRANAPYDIKRIVVYT